MKLSSNESVPQTISMRTAGMEAQLKRWRRKHPFAPWSMLLRRSVNEAVPKIKHRRKAVAA